MSGDGSGGGGDGEVGGGGAFGDDTGHGGGVSVDQDSETGEDLDTISYSAHASVTDAEAAAPAANVGLQAQSAALSIESGFGTVGMGLPGHPSGTGQTADEAAAAAIANTGFDPTEGNVTNTGQVTVQGAINMAQNIGTNPVALGAHSVPGGLGAASEVAQAAIAANPNPSAITGVTASDIAALSQTMTDPSTGQQMSVINVPNPPMGTPGFAQASNTSFIAASLNPSFAGLVNAVGMAMMPAPMAGIVGAMQAAQAEEMDLPAPPSTLGSIMGSLTEPEVAPISGVEMGTSISDMANQANLAVGQAIGTGLNVGLGAISDALDATVGAGLNEVQAGLDSIGLGSSATPESMAADAVAEAGAVGGGPEVPVGRQPLIRVVPDRDDERRAVIAGTVEAGAVDSFLGDVETQPLLPIPDFTLGASDPVLGGLEDLGVTSTLSPVSRGSSFRRSRITSPRDRAFGAVNLFRPTLSAGISL